MDISLLGRKRGRPSDGKEEKDAAKKGRIKEPEGKRLPKVGGWNEYSDGLRTHYEKRATEDALKRRVYSREKASVDRLHDTFMCEGDRIVERIRIRMNSMGLVKTKPLKQIWDAILMGHLQIIYGSDYVRKIPELLKEFGVDELYQMSQILTMRQAGKTTGVQSGLAACMLEIQRNKDVAFAPTKRQSVAIMKGVIDFIMRQKDGPQRIRSNQEELVVSPASAGTFVKSHPGNSILRCLPASEKGYLSYNVVLPVLCFASPHKQCPSSAIRHCTALASRRRRSKRAIYTTRTVSPRTWPWFSAPGFNPSPSKGNGPTPLASKSK